MDLLQTPPEMGQRIHRMIRELTGCNDPYREFKHWANSSALELLPKLRGLIEDADDPVEMALRISIAGNVIDFGAKPQMGEINVRDAIDESLVLPLDGDLEEFRDAVSMANDILYLLDNSGEIVFDGLLIEYLGAKNITAVVRGAPVINDSTMVDAEECGITKLVAVIDNGSDVPGTLLDECSDEFRRRFDAADLIIAKGQGNYETLSEADADIFFILKVKCAVIAKDIGCDVGSMVLKRSR
jgi:uncharacterized protein with ATP-grasp and redox domains